MFPVSEAPDFRRSHGYAYGVGMVVAMVVWCAAIIPLLSRYWIFKDDQACLDCDCDEPVAEATCDRPNKAADASD